MAIGISSSFNEPEWEIASLQRQITSGNALRQMMIDTIRSEVKGASGSYRYSSFYSPKPGDTKHERKFNARAVRDNLFNIDTLEGLTDEELLRVYDRFSIRRWTQM
jgi:hypothetical protein